MEVAVGGADRAKLVAVPTRDPAGLRCLPAGPGRRELGRGRRRAAMRARSPSSRTPCGATPTLVDAWAGLASARTLLYANGLQPTPTLAAAARTAAERTLALDPAGSRGLTARGQYRAYVARDLAGARADLEAAVRADPADVEARSPWRASSPERSGARARHCRTSHAGWPSTRGVPRYGGARPGRSACSGAWPRRASPRTGRLPWHPVSPSPCTRASSSTSRPGTRPRRAPPSRDSPRTSRSRTPAPLAATYRGRWTADRRAVLATDVEPRGTAALQGRVAGVYLSGATRPARAGGTRRPVPRAAAARGRRVAGASSRLDGAGACRPPAARAAKREPHGCVAAFGVDRGGIRSALTSSRSTAARAGRGTRPAGCTTRAVASPFTPAASASTRGRAAAR
jgi:hypothetical protein